MFESADRFKLGPPKNPSKETDMDESKDMFLSAFQIRYFVLLAAYFTLTSKQNGISNIIAEKILLRRALQNFVRRLQHGAKIFLQSRIR